MKYFTSAKILSDEINEKHGNLFSAKPRQDQMRINCVVVTNKANGETKALYSHDSWWKYAKDFGIERPKPAVKYSEINTDEAPF